jgi:methylglutaconyl-CoA hydratase
MTDMSDENPMTHPLVPEPAPDAEGPIRVEASPSGVVVVTLDRAKARNRMTQALQGALREAFETLHGADHVRLVLIRGAGGCFCAGRDPEWIRLTFDWSEGDLRDDALDQGRMLKALHEIPALTVALVEGEAYGPGVGLVAACDMALATETARFGFPELKFGLLPSVSAPYLADAVGPRHAQALLGTGRIIDAHVAQRIGLVQAVVADEPALATLAEQLTGDTLACAPEAAAEAKRLAWRVWGRPIDHGMLEETARRFAARRTSHEGTEGAQAFLDGRSPNWNL